ncbi:hypothetical protein [Marinigracilibium pacificum]|uniref:Uncharacterized protein n=1 Tax=Marinigracilibium pacificum TaxID=2729599 RepID=A0A848IYS4_9BACT|nr:hypothetical protein [Marinigracilibium pacificum]NMM49673.1 hypothetical protein [Marinigracilibium pacificum]
MIEKSQTISKKAPELKSMQYELLRETGIKHIQELAGKLWTDYNSHDPGITMLEAISYVITDIGFRVNYDIKDILAQKLTDTFDIKNFYTAGKILPNCPVTKNDYRKLMMDVEVVDEIDGDCKYAGVKNAWISRSPVAEHEIFVNNSKSKLSLDPVPLVPEQDSYYVNALYDVLLEFDSCDTYGDLNSNTIDKDLVIFEHLPDPNIQGVRFNIKIEFPRWDNAEVNWEDLTSVQANIINVTVKIFDLPDNYTLNTSISNKNEVILTGNKEIGGTISAIDGLSQIIDKVNEFVYDPIEGLVQLYVQKVNKIHEIVSEVFDTLHANRSLCDDYYKFNALKVEEILLCTDIEIDPTADVETVEANIYYEISKFLSPQVNFYTLEEMLNKCRNQIKYEVGEIKRFKKTFTINQALEEDINQDDIITLLNAGELDGEYTVSCIGKNKENPEFTDIQVYEDILTNEFNEGAYIFRGTIDDTLCLTVDKVFEGPLLKHGFIDDDELNRAERIKCIHVSDLIRIIMDVEGVLAVNSIQIANRALDNTDNIPSKSVKWCLELAMEENYVPRLNLDDSKITFFKDQLPYHANRIEVRNIIEALEDNSRPQKIHYPKMDIPIPKGEFKDLEAYISVQEEFPQSYGVGSKGIPGLEALDDTGKVIKKTEVKQLKGFLLFFDQLLANYTSQLSHVKDLFSMNGEKDKFGNYLIDKTYFSQPLFDIIPNADPLYVDKSGHVVKLQEIVEDQKLYETRRNKFLDHLLARFAETFTDYALLSYKISGSKAPEELIEDKLKFLNDYPDLSKSRGKGFNYMDECKNWHVDNVSGLENRVSLLTGIEPWPIDKLAFTNNFKVIPDGLQFKGQIEDDSANVLLETALFDTENEVKEAFELLLISGVNSENFEIFEKDGDLVFDLKCKEEQLGVSVKTYTNDVAGTDEAEDDIDTLVEVLEREYFTNPQSNRKNLSCPILNYFEYEVVADMTPVDPEPPTFTINYTLYSKSFGFTSENALLEGSITRPAEVGDTEAEVLEKGEEYAHQALWDVINNGSSRGHYTFDSSGSYHFSIHDRYGENIGLSIANDFNDAVADEAANLTSGQVEVSGSTHHDGTYDVIGATADGATVEIEIDGALAPLEYDGMLSWTESFAIESLDLDNRIIEIGNDITGLVKVGEKISITNSTSNDADYTILSLEAGGAGTLIGIKEPISDSEDPGEITYSKQFEITGITASSFIIKGMADEEAIQELIDFIEGTFFYHEGMHVIEHVLLRPRVNEMLFIIPEGETLQEGLIPQGDLYFQKIVPIVSASVEDSQIKVAGDITSEMAVTSIINITGGSFNDGQYKVSSIAFDGTDTVISTKIDETPIAFDLPDSPHLNGDLVYIKKASIDNVVSADNKIIISDSDALNLQEGNKILIKDSQDSINDRRYLVSSVIDNAGSIEVTFDRIEELVQDSLLPIHLDQDCESCKQKDPYSFVASVVLPYWPGRFINLDFRKYMNKTIRLETPAHVMLNICWISCEHMSEFEEKYKRWLVEIGKDEPDKAKLSNALTEFIDILTRIRNVYPTGKLHSCEEDDTLEGVIILNNSVLGTFNT